MVEQHGEVPRQAVVPDGKPQPSLTAAEAAGFLRVDIVDVLDAIRDGTLPVVRRGEESLIDREVLFRMLDPLYEAPAEGSLRGRVDAAARVCEAIVGEGYVSTSWRAAASRLLGDLVTVATRHGISLDDFDCVTDLPQACLDALAPAYRPRPQRPLRSLPGGTGRFIRP
jgi:hypothetical protein